MKRSLHHSNGPWTESSVKQPKTAAVTGDEQPEESEKCKLPKEVIFHVSLAQVKRLRGRESPLCGLIITLGNFPNSTDMRVFASVLSFPKNS